MRLITYHFVGYALTPVHIGDGTTMTPDGYRLRSSSPAILERFDPPAVIAAMSPAQRAAYIRALSQGGVKQAQEILRKAADSAIREQVSISQYSRDEIGQVITNPLRRGRISPFVRSGGTPILPGSSVKGAVRTAWLAREARFIARDEVRDLSTRIRRAGPGKTGREAEKIYHTAFESEQNHTEQDPLRDISVSDAPLEVDGTLIDRVHVANCTKEGPIALDGQGGCRFTSNGLLRSPMPASSPRSPSGLQFRLPTARRSANGGLRQGLVLRVRATFPAPSRDVRLISTSCDRR